MDDAANGNAGLMRRIVQLETEKDELQRDIETLCMQQSGFPGSIDIVSRMQARKAAGFEQELEACKQKLALHTKENLNLQRELAETYRVKGRVADAFKATMDKNKELEKEVKFYQSRMAGAFAERDKAVMELERLQTAEKSITNELHELHDRLEQTNVRCSEQEKSYAELQHCLEGATLELKRAQRVVEKFWQLGEYAKKNGDLDDKGLVDKAQVLLEDDDANWVYGLVEDSKTNLAQVEEELKYLKDAQQKLDGILALAKDASMKLEEELVSSKTAQEKLEEVIVLIKAASSKLEDELVLTKAASRELEEELVLKRASSTDLRLQLEEEQLLRKNVEEKTSIISAQLVLKRDSFTRELQQLRVQLKMLKTMISTSLEDQKMQVPLILESLQHAFEKAKSKLLQTETGTNVEEGESMVVVAPHERKSLRVHFEDEGASQSSTSTKEEQEFGCYNIVKIVEDDSREVLAQALQEKVEALLLLSQQEERYFLEASTQSALEAQVTILNQKLAQVTGEKVTALLELAEQRQHIHRLQERERELMQGLERQRSTYPGGGLLPAGWSETKLHYQPQSAIVNQDFEDKPAVKEKHHSTSTGGYLKGWLRGLDISAFKTTSTGASKNSSVGVLSPPINKSDGGNNVSRLLIENATLQQRVASMQHLAKSAHRLRMTLAKVATELQGEFTPSSIQSSMQIVESVKSEAKQLKVALGSSLSSLPVSFQGPLEGSADDNASMEHSSEELFEEDEEQAEVPLHDSLSMAGMEMAELLLTTADLQRDSLLTKLSLSSSTA